MSIKIGDWFVLYQMSKNLNRRFFYDFLIRMANESNVNQDNEIVTLLEAGKEEPSTSLKKSDSQPPPLMQGTPKITLKKVHTT